jgi:TetR/AcrR family transcriptional repressor of nem operon
MAGGLRRMQERGELTGDADVERLAVGLLTAVQGGLLLARTARWTAPLAVALPLALDGVQRQQPAGKGPRKTLRRPGRTSVFVM